MDWADLGRSIIKLGAPLLGSVIGGPAGGAIGAIVASQFGANPDDPKEILAKINGDPEAAIKLLAIQSNREIELEKLKIKQAQLEVKDKESARQREIDLADKGKRDYTPPLLALCLTIGFFGLLMTIILIRIQPDALTIVKIMIGSLGSAWLMAISYYFGSSFGSRQKDKLK